MNKKKQFKKRKLTGYVKPKLFFGEFSIIISKNVRLEFVYFKFLKRLLKIFFKKNNLNFLEKKSWFFLKKNFQLSKKSKNSRMGKGKGSFLRYCVKKKKNSTLLEFLGFNIFQLNKICLKYRKYTKIPIHVFFLINKTYPQFSNQNFLIYFCKKNGIL